MSKVKIQGHASGSGVLTITAPATNTDRTFALPDEAGSILTSVSALSGANVTDQTITAAKLNDTLNLAAKNVTLSAAASGFTKIFDQSLDSNHASMTVDNVFNSTYDMYKIFFYERRPQASSFAHEGRLVFRTGGASGVDYNGNYTARKYRDYSGHTTYEADSQSTTSLLISSYNALNRGQIVEMTVYLPYKTDFATYFDWWHIGYHPSNDFTFPNNGRGGLTDASIAPTGFKFYSPTGDQGNYSYARCVVYGAKL